MTAFDWVLGPDTVQMPSGCIGCGLWHASGECYRLTVTSTSNGYICSNCGCWQPADSGHVCSNAKPSAAVAPLRLGLWLESGRVPDFTPAMPKRAKRKKQ